LLEERGLLEFPLFKGDREIKISGFKQKVDGNTVSI
jgi:hypothetical protein